MTDATPATRQPAAPSPAPAGLSHAFDAVEDKGAYAQVRKPDGDGSWWVKRADLPPDTSRTSSPGRPDWCPESAWDPNGFNAEAFTKHWNETIQPALTWHAAQEVRRNTLPPNADAMR